MSTLNVVFLWHSMHALSGVSTFLRALLRYLPRHGCNPLVIELERHEGSPTEDDSESIVEIGPRPLLTPVAYRRRVLRAIDRHRAHVVVCADQKGSSFLPELTGLLPLVSIVQNYPDQPNYSRELDEVLPWLSGVVVISSAIAANVTAPVHSRIPVTVIPNGTDVDADEIQSVRPADRVRFIYSGRLDEKQKQVSQLPGFLEQFSRKGIPFELLIAGAGPEESVLKRELEPWKPNVTFLGRLAPEVLRTCYASCHYLLLFSKYEGGPLVALEAMVTGCIPVLPNIQCAVVERITSGLNGILYRPNDMDDAVRSVLSVRGRWEDVSREAVDLVRDEFSNELMARRYAELLRSLALSNPPGRLAYRDVRYRGRISRAVRRVLPIYVYQDWLGRVV